MQYTEADLIADVKAEAEKLKNTATATELARLNIKYVRPDSHSHCIYGQITGSCFSGRATALIMACTPRYFERDVIEWVCTQDEKMPVNEAIRFANGTVVESFASDRQQRWPMHYSAIEAYICTEGAKIKNLVGYLKGETDTLEL